MIRFFFQLLFLASITSCAAQKKTELFFETASFELSEKSIVQLEGITSDLQIISIHGFCDSRASASYNDSLSINRAESVASFLKERGISLSGVEVKGFGENKSQPRVAASDRKVVITFAGKANDFKSQMASAETGKKIILKKLNFYNMSDRFLPESIPVIKELLETLQANPKLKIEIQGHICCTTQSADQYFGISTARAKAVYKYLISNGIEASRLSYKGFGATRPLYKIPEKSEKEQRENRRVEIEIIER